MDFNEAQTILFRASRLRVPAFRHQREDDEPPHTLEEKVHLLECWAVDAARWRSHLEEARLWMDETAHRLSLDWKSMTGWEEYLPDEKRRKDAKRDDITEAKRLKDPDLFKSLEDARHVVKQLSEQIRRIEKDEERVSRIYTFITGGS